MWWEIEKMVGMFLSHVIGITPCEGCIKSNFWSCPHFVPRGKIEKSKEEIDLVHSLHMLQRRVPLSTSKLIQDFIYVFKRSGKYSYWCIVHNLFGCDNLITIWVANQSSSIISTVGGCLNSLGEGSFFFFLLFSLFYRLELNIKGYMA